MAAIDLGGTIRTRSAEETLEKLRKRIPEFGITRVASVTGLDVIGVPVWMAVRPLARSLTVSQGKGVSDPLAIISAVMESIEIHHAENLQTPGTVVSLAEAWQDERFASADSLTLRSDAKITDETRTAWIEGWDEARQCAAWLPRELFDLDLRMRRGDAATFLASSNGLASGNTRIEAVVHGLCEVIERDQSCLWQMEQCTVPDPRARMVRLDSIDEPSCLAQIAACHRANLDIWVWHCTYDIDVPVFACMIADRGNATFYPQRASGYGCHPVASIALSRAITEAIQSRLTHISGVRDDVTWERYRNDLQCTDPSNARAFEQMAAMQPPLSFPLLPSAPRGQTFEEMRDYILEKLAAVSLTSAITIDLDSQMEDFSVVFVCVPGLEFGSNKPLYTPGERMLNFIARLDRAA